MNENLIPVENSFRLIHLFLIYFIWIASEVHSLHFTIRHLLCRITRLHRALENA
jgi:hypothetical protein